MFWPYLMMKRQKWFNFQKNSIITFNDIGLDTQIFDKNKL